MKEVIRNETIENDIRTTDFCIKISSIIVEMRMEYKEASVNRKVAHYLRGRSRESNRDRRE